MAQRRAISVQVRKIMFKQYLMEASKGGAAVLALRKLNYDIDGAIDADNYKDVENVINDWLKDGDEEMGKSMELSGKDLEVYLNYLYDIQDDPRGAWKVISQGETNKAKGK